MFPTIRNIEDVMPAIQDREEFKINEKPDQGLIAIDYVVTYKDTFPELGVSQNQNQISMLRRECRGIKFCYKTGDIISRTPHKFFNLGEREETFYDNIDWNQPFIILDKLDGSMISPVVINDEVVYCTKFGYTDASKLAHDFAHRGIANVISEITDMRERTGISHKNDRERVFYNDFCYDLLKSGYTPTFEWCSPDQRIILKYDHDQLVLTSVRKTITGEYLDYDQMVALADPYRVPVVRKYTGDFENINSFVEKIKHHENEEGYVIRFRDGSQYKVKNLWYVQLHKTQEMLRFEKDVWVLCLRDSVDDALSFLQEDEGQKLVDFKNEMDHRIQNLSDDIKQYVEKAYAEIGNDRKKFAEEYVNKYPAELRGVLFSTFSGECPHDKIKKLLLKNTSSSTKVARNQNILGIAWEG